MYVNLYKATQSHFSVSGPAILQKLAKQSGLNYIILLAVSH